LKQFAAVAKKLNLSADEAAELLNFETGRTASSRKALQELTAQNTKRLRDELQDQFKEKAEEKLAGAYKVIEQFGDAELRKELDATGMGNNPRLIKMLIKVGAHFAEKGITAAGTGLPAAKDEGVDLKQVYQRSYATGAMK
jgi:predicted house-cleaning noncanonical NTP pyrophosphatase (MazG superfamily)